MINTDVIWLVLLAGSLVAVWAVFMYFVPHWLCSMFRYRLWRLRDSVQDDIIYGRLPNHDFVRELVSFIEGAIRVADKLTLLRLLFTPTNREESERWEKKVKDADITAQQKKAIDNYRRQFVKILVFRMILGSFSGWFVLIVFLLPLCVIFCIRDIVKKAPISIDRLLEHYFRILIRIYIRPDPLGKLLAFRAKAKNDLPLSAFAA